MARGARGSCARGTCKKLGVEHVDRLVVPGILTLQVDGVQKVFDEGGQDHGEQDGVLGGRHGAAHSLRLDSELRVAETGKRDKPQIQTPAGPMLLG